MHYGAQNSVLQNVENYNNRTMRRFVVGADGVFNLFDIDWNFKAYGEHGEVDYHNTLENILITPYYDAAIDAVHGHQQQPGHLPRRSGRQRDLPFRGGAFGRLRAAEHHRHHRRLAGGAVFCAGHQCRWQQSRAPMAAFPWQIVNSRQEVLDVGISGDVLENWAGKISVATGFQYREEAFQGRRPTAPRAAIAPMKCSAACCMARPAIRC